MTGCEVICDLGTVAIGGGTFAGLPMAHERGDELLDYTDPYAPVLIEAGIYSFAATAECAEGPQYSGNATLIVGIGPMFGEGGVSVDQQIDLRMFPTPRASATMPPWRAEAGDTVGLVVWNYYGLPLRFRAIMGLLSKGSAL